MTAPTNLADARPRRGPDPLEVVVLVLVAAVVLIRLPFPFTGDQALFAAGADALRGGERLYVDLWDAKQPGIYLWFALAGRGFGTSTVGIHLAEAVQAVVAARLVQVLLRGRVRHRWTAVTAPVLTVGALYAPARAWDLSQVEVLTPTALLAVMVLVTGAPADGRGRAVRLVGAGLVAAWVAWLKLLYLPIPLVMLAVALRRARRPGRDARWVAVGLTAGLAPLVAYAVANGLVGELWWSWFVYPSQSQRVDPPPLRRLADALRWELRVHGWLAALALLGLVGQRPRGRRAWPWSSTARPGAAGGAAPAVQAGAGAADPVSPPVSPPVSTPALVWLGLGCAAVLSQKWWGYHFCLLVVPLGLLAALGIDRALDAARGSRRRALAAGALGLVGLVGALPPALELAHVTRVVAGHGFGTGTADRLRIEREFEPYTPAALAAARVVPGPAGAPVHVMGNPIIQWRSGRAFAIALNGWSPEQFTARLWARNRHQLAAALAEGRLGALWVDETSARIWRTRSPDTWAWMRGRFRPARTVADGVWFLPR